mgnify:CR=1 FL=1
MASTHTACTHWNKPRALNQWDWHCHYNKMVFTTNTEYWVLWEVLGTQNWKTPLREPSVLFGEDMDTDNCNKVWDIHGVVGSKVSRGGQAWAESWRKLLRGFKQEHDKVTCIFFRRSHWCNVRREKRVREETRGRLRRLRGRSFSKHILKGRTRFLSHLKEQMNTLWVLYVSFWHWKFSPLWPAEADTVRELYCRWTRGNGNLEKEGRREENLICRIVSMH